MERLSRIYFGWFRTIDRLGSLNDSHSFTRYSYCLSNFKSTNMTNLNDHIKQQQEVNRGKLTQLEDSKKPTPGIEEKRGKKIGEDKYTEHWSLDGSTYIQVPKWVITKAHQAGIDEAVEKRNGVIREYEDEGAMFIIKVEDGKTYEASMPIPKWTEVGKITLRDDTIKALQDKK